LKHGDLNLALSDFYEPEMLYQPLTPEQNTYYVGVLMLDFSGGVLEV